jgi:hypothetical protein
VVVVVFRFAWGVRGVSWCGLDGGCGFFGLGFGVGTLCGRELFKGEVGVD